MSWTTATKNLDVAKIAGHALTRPHVTGRAPSTAAIAFTPAALFGATARCSHLHPINPHLVSPEPLEELRFSNSTWRGRDWIAANEPELMFPSEAGSLAGPQFRFALDEGVARACLRRLVVSAPPSEPIGVRPILADLTSPADDGAIFPMGWP